MRCGGRSPRPGADTAFDVGQMKIGRRLAIKLLNASKFTLTYTDRVTDDPALITAPLDRALLARLAITVDDATKAFEAYDYTRALEGAERFFWDFTDDYVELVKDRAYGGQGEAGALSASATLGVALDTLLRLFAPFLPFVTEEVWSWWREGSVHTATWPEADRLRLLAGDGDAEALEPIASVLAAVRKAKSEAKVSMRHPVSSAVVVAPEGQAVAVESARGDLMAAGSVAAFEVRSGDSPLEVTVELAPVAPAAEAAAD